MTNRRVSRRHFLMAGGATLAGCAAGGKGNGNGTPSLTRLGYRSPNERLAVAAIGAGGKGAVDIGACARENVVALCDVDWKNAAETFARFPQARRYKDFRQMLDREKLDAVTISTADHTHAAAALSAMQRGLHVYLQKPLTHNVKEARLLTEAARKYRVATQMGNQGHSNEGARLLCELVWSGAIGDVREVHAWTNRPIWPQGIGAALAGEAVPDHLDWDLFLGPAPMRAFNPAYTPFKWRGWWDWGSGALGDMACHILDGANWALQLSHPTSVECIRQEGRTAEAFPTKSIVRFQFPARRTMPALTLTWYEGGLLPPRPAGVPEGQKLGDGNNGSLLIGDKGILTTGTYSERTRLLPDERMVDFKPPPQLLTRSPGHYQDWIRACKGGEPACSSFDYSGPFTEWVLLGTVAQRFEGKLLWDAANLRFTNHPEANQYLTRAYRPGWELPAIVTAA
jgi:predicted dehydrogenase